MAHDGRRDGRWCGYLSLGKLARSGGGDGLVVCRRRIVDFSQQAREGVRRLCGRGSDVSASSVAAKDAERFHMSVVPSASVSNSRRGDTRALQITRYFLLVRFGGDLVMVYVSRAVRRMPSYVTRNPTQTGVLI